MSASRWIARSALVAPASAGHLALRVIGFPRLADLERHVPRQGTILDAGCGHGLVSLLLAERGPERRVLGVDRLGARLRFARRMAERHGLADRLAFVEADLGSLPSGLFSGIVVADVLMYLPPARQAAVLEAFVERLAPGGTLVLSEQVREPAWKARLVALQERIVLGVRVRAGQAAWGEIAGDGVCLRHRDELTRILERLGLEVTSQPLDAGTWLSHHLFVGRVPSAGLQRDAGAPARAVSLATTSSAARR